VTAPRLKTLVIENFRSLRGKIVVPLDAQVVLIHGTNGMGKTSVLSALELGLTGRIGHLATNGDGYQAYVTTLDTESGSIELTTTESYKEGAKTGGSLNFSDNLFAPTPLLDSDDAKFFAERCYLPQATLGRLLEIYDDLETNTTSPLTQFVKELLGLDPLDALVDGLHPAYNVTRVRNLVPQYRRLEGLQSSLRDEIKRSDQSIAANTKSSADRLGALNATLSQLPSAVPLVVNNATNLTALRTELTTAREEERVLTDLSRTRSELKALTEQWRSLPADDSSHDRASKERREQAAAELLDAWRSGSGNELSEIITALRARFSDLPLIDDGPEESRAAAERRAEAEAKRCAILVNNSMAATERVNSLNTTIQRANTRIQELNSALAAGAEDIRSLASALAGVSPHVSGETCPVCDRDFTELGSGPLSVHIADKIASLTSEAGRLQSLVNERAEESNRLSVAKRNLLSAGTDLLSAEDLAELTVRASQMTSAAERLKTLAAAADTGTTLIAEAATARVAVSLARRRDEMLSSILPEVETIILSLTERQASSFDSIGDALTEAEHVLRNRLKLAETSSSLRIRALTEVDLYAKDVSQITSLKDERDLLVARLSTLESARSEVDESRERAKRVADTADRVRSGIVKTVFNTTLNKVWRDLFVRLAPSEQFVPTFRLPSDDGGNVEAVLETLHRSGKSSGPPGAMLSQGNLNTAALTLFLALHLSVPSRMPWLVLDDPVQSMDDVHIAQFAALLRTLSKGMDRQLVVAVHERALFDYLTLELSPAFPGDSLISVEITQNFEGYTVANPRAFSYEKDRAIAA
jgi:DNA repair protein SbcC/Rad50